MELYPVLRTYYHLKDGKEVICGVRLVNGKYVADREYDSVDELLDGYNRQGVQ